jgi:hypothetical protein
VRWHLPAIAHTLLKIAYSVLKTGKSYADLGADFYTRRESPDARQDYLMRQLQKLTEAAPRRRIESDFRTPEGTDVWPRQPAPRTPGGGAGAG